MIRIFSIISYPACRKAGSQIYIHFLKIINKIRIFEAEINEKQKIHTLF